MLTYLGKESTQYGEPLRHNYSQSLGQLVETMRYKSQGREFDSRWCHWNFSLTSFRPHYGSGVDSGSNKNA
jgi:hypothetical protein